MSTRGGGSVPAVVTWRVRVESLILGEWREAGFRFRSRRLWWRDRRLRRSIPDF